MCSVPQLHWSERFRPLTLGVLRAVSALLFWQHGVWKLFGWFGGSPAAPYSIFWFAGVIETVCAPLLLMGLLTRPIALLFCGEMAIAYLTQHLPHGFWPIQTEGVVPLQYLAIFLLLAAAGPGHFAADAWLAKAGKDPLRRWAAQLDAFYPAALTILRLMTAFHFWQFGVRKIFGWFGGPVVQFGALRWFAGMLEVGGAPLIALGALTRPLAFVLCGEMAAAYWISHFPRGYFWPIQNGGEPAVLFCSIYLFLATAGPGKLSVDGLQLRNRKPVSIPDEDIMLREE